MGGLEYNLWHLGYDDAITKRVNVTYYEGGHMMYTNPEALKALSNDLRVWISGKK